MISKERCGPYGMDAKGKEAEAKQFNIAGEEVSRREAQRVLRMFGFPSEVHEVKINITIVKDKVVNESALESR
jgi:hypothetical protein